jgi:hypothetical protein
LTEATVSLAVVLIKRSVVARTLELGCTEAFTGGIVTAGTQILNISFGLL